MKPSAIPQGKLRLTGAGRLAVSLALILLIAGCASISKVGELSKEVVHKIHTPHSGLKPYIAFTRFEDTSFVRDKGMAALFQQRVADRYSQKCRNTWIMTPENPVFPNFLFNPPKLASGRIDDFALAKSGRQQGMYAIVTGSLFNISGDHRQKGFLWFKNTIPQVNISLAMAVYDTETGTKLMDRSEVRSFDVDDEDFDAIRQKNKAGLAVLAGLIRKTAENFGDRLCETLSASQWKCYVSAVNGTDITLSAGSRSGLKPGRVFEVYAPGKLIKGVNGLRFLERGEKVADIKVTSVSQDTATAVLTSGKSVSVGDTVVLPS